MCEALLAYVEQRTLLGGCFFAAAAAAELGARPGPVRGRVAAYESEWIGLLTAAANDAAARRQLRDDIDMPLLVFEFAAVVVAANTGFILHDDPTVIDRARAAAAHLVDAAAQAPPGR